MSKPVTVVDYGLGNLFSVSRALEQLGYAAALTDSAAGIDAADCVLLPGVGAFGDGMRALERRGLVAALNEKVIDEKTPYLGVCLGMQFLATTGFEHGEHAGFGWIAGEVTRITPADAALKVPHMGWNELGIEAGDCPLLRDVAPGTAVYFLHGYHFIPAANAADTVVATADHGGRIVAAVQRGHVFGVKFHP